MNQSNHIDRNVPRTVLQPSLGASFVNPPCRLRQNRWLPKGRLFFLGLAVTLSAGCDSAPPTAGSTGSGGAAVGNGNVGGGNGGASAGGAGGAGGVADAGPVVTLNGTLSVSSATSVPVEASAFGINYWSWPSGYGSNLSGTETPMSALHPKILRIGGTNNDTNAPNPFDATQLAIAVTYAKAVGSQILWQVPLLNDDSGATPTPQTAADMVTLANVTNNYAIKYFSIGNEPDLYATNVATLSTFSATDYCAKVSAFVPAMKAVDSTIKIVGPDLSWKYQSGDNDWLTLILQQCGQYFDIVSVHRYPFDPTVSTAANAVTDADTFKAVIASLRSKMANAGYGGLPLAITETNITWDGTPAKSVLDASPGTLPAGLWMADTLGVGLSQGLWSIEPWSTREGWTLGFISPTNVLRPSYYAALLFAGHFGTTAIGVTASPANVHAYASRAATGNATQLIIVNYNAEAYALDVEQTGVATNPPAASVTALPMSITAANVTDTGTVTTWTYSQTEFSTGQGPTASN